MNLNIGENVTGKALSDFFEAVLGKRWNEAEKILQEIGESIKGENSEFKRGFLQGLKGILYMQRSNEQYTFIETLNTKDVDLLKEYHREFLENSKKRLRPDYDRGYFLALAEYLSFLVKRAESEEK